MSDSNLSDEEFGSDEIVLTADDDVFINGYDLSRINNVNEIRDEDSVVGQDINGHIRERHAGLFLFQKEQLAGKIVDKLRSRYILTNFNIGPRGVGTASEYIDNFVLPRRGLDLNNVTLIVYNRVKRQYDLNRDAAPIEGEIAQVVIEAIIRRYEVEEEDASEAMQDRRAAAEAEDAAAAAEAAAEATRLAEEEAAARRAELEARRAAQAPRARAREPDAVFAQVRRVDEARQAAEREIRESRLRPPTEAEIVAARAETATRQAKIKADLAAAQARLTAAAAEEQTVFGKCQLCLESINHGDEAVDAHDIEGKPSGHIYHKDCIMTICNDPKPSNRVCPECRAKLLCDEIKSGDRDINTNLGLKGGKRIKRSSKRSRRHVKKDKKITRKGKKGKKYTNKRMRMRSNKIAKKGRKTFRR